MNWLKKLFTKDDCEQAKKELEQKVVILEAELEKRQEAINRTNAYWKKRFYNRRRNPSSS